MPTHDLVSLDATAQAALVRSGEATPLELVDAAIARIERVNPKVNAVILPLFEKARDQARSGRLPDGPFLGVPFLVKDLFCSTAGDPFHCGMRFLKDLGWTAAEDTYLAAKFRAAGFVFVGRTNVPELGPVTTTEPVAYGKTRNPWNVDHSPGGSSGGSAAAVAAGMVPVAHANDGGGSIRIPASHCGLFGLKPSHGRNSLGPDVGSSWDGAVAEHVVSRSVRDSAALLDATAGPMPGDPVVAPPPARPFREEVGAAPGSLRIGVLRRAPGNQMEIHRDCLAAVDDTARLLGELGHRVEESHPAALDEVDENQSFVKIVSAWLRADLSGWSRRTGREIREEDVEPLTWALAEMGRDVSAVDYVEASLDLQRRTRRIATWWEDGFDLLLTPTMAEPPPRLGEFDPAPGEPLRAMYRNLPFVVFTSPFNVTGQPAASIPLHWNDAGLPVGSHLVAAYGREDLLFRVAAQLEEARPWAGKTPPNHASR